MTEVNFCIRLLGFRHSVNFKFGSFVCFILCFHHEPLAPLSLHSKHYMCYMHGALYLQL